MIIKPMSNYSSRIPATTVFEAETITATEDSRIFAPGKQKALLTDYCNFFETTTGPENLHKKLGHHHGVYLLLWFVLSVG